MAAKLSIVLACVTSCALAQYAAVQPAAYPVAYAAYPSVAVAKPSYVAYPKPSYVAYPKPSYVAYPKPSYVAVEPSYSAPTPYSFEYSVNDPSTYDVKGQAESGDGNGNVSGFYSVLEPDGTTRVVEYTADDRNGFNAVVRKEGAPARVPRE